MTLSVMLRHRFTQLELAIDFVTRSPGVTALFGPSGAGKSSVLNAAAGLLRPVQCRIELDGRVLGDTAGEWLPPERRRVGLVFQDARLFPHLRVAGNLRYGLRRAPHGPVGFDEVVALLGIGHLLGRRPHTLSGGERQRVAIGRALLAQPRLLLLDEPLAGLDEARKAEILPYLARLKTALRLPVLYVTHDMDEVVRLADDVVLIEAGHVVAAGSIADIAARGDLDLARRDDAGAVLDAKVVAHDPARQLTCLDGGVPILVPLTESPPETSLRLRIPAREVILARERPAAISVQNVLEGTVRTISLDTERHAAFVEVVAGGQAILARVTPDSVERLALAPGVPVVAMFKSMGVEVLGPA